MLKYLGVLCTSYCEMVKNIYGQQNANKYGISDCRIKEKGLCVNCTILSTFLHIRSFSM